MTRWLTPLDTPPSALLICPLAAVCPAPAASRTVRLTGFNRLRDGAADNVPFTPLWDAERQQLLLFHGYDEQGARSESSTIRIFIVRACCREISLNLLDWRRWPAEMVYRLNLKIG